MRTESGFEYEISPEVLDDWELIEDMQEMMESSDPLKLISVFKTVLGDDQYKNLKEHLRKRDGRVKTSAMMKELDYIFQGEDAKKS